MKRISLLAFFVALLFVTRGSAQEIRINMNCDVSTIVTPDHAIGVRCWKYRGDSDLPITADLVRITTAEALALANSKGVPRLTNAQPVDTVALTNPTGDSNEAMYEATLNPAGPGAYAVRVHRDKWIIRVALTTVSRFGLATMIAGGSSLVAPIDLKTSRVFREPILVQREDGDRAVALKRSSDGIFTDTFSSKDEGIGYVAVANDGSIAIATAWNYYRYRDTSSGLTMYAQTDRPVYRPGDRVDLRAILRRGTIGSYAIDRKPIVLTVNQGYQSHSIAQRTLKPDEFGTVSTTVQLPADADLGTYYVMIDKQWSTSFEVQAYKKPEYTLDLTPLQPFTLAGDTARFRVHLAYLFGGTAANLKIHYTARTYYRNNDWFGPYSYSRAGHTENAEASGDVTTGNNGSVEVAVPTTRYGLDGQIMLHIDARDESGRTVSQETYGSVVRATFHLIVDPASWYGSVTAPNSVTVHSLTHEGKARPYETLNVHIVRQWWDKDKYQERTIEQRTIRTDASGNAQFSYLAPEPGEYRFDVTGRDEHGNDVAASQMQWVFDPHSAWVPHIDRAQIVQEKSMFAPGEKLRGTLVLTQPAQQAIVAVLADGFTSHAIVPVHGLTASLVLDAPRDAQLAQVKACVPSEQGLSCVDATFGIDPPTKLNIVVTPDKRDYRPGETAHVRLHVTDRNGKPVRAQLSLGVVDEGIYAVVEDQRPDPNVPFYQRVGYAYADSNWYRPNANPFHLKMIAKVTSRAGGQLVKAGVASDVYNVNASGSANGVPSAYSALATAKTRTKFADTAYWTPNAVTDANGDATVTFTWPENVTTWRASAIGVTAATQFGTQKAEVLVHKPLIARLEIPRFMRAGDTATVIGIAQSEKSGNRVVMQLDPGALGSKTTPSELTIDDSKRASTSWTLHNPGVGMARLALRIADGNDSDGLELGLPLLGATPLAHDRFAGNVNESATVPTSLGAGELAGALHVSFSPSMIAQLSQTLRAFDVYPYYCTEQTSSNAIVAAALLSAGAKAQNLALPTDPKRVIEKARAKLKELRHSDGAWGWWSSDETSVFMTGYALYAIDAMDKAVGTDDNYYKDEAARALAQLLKKRDGRETEAERALAVYALSRTRADLLTASSFDPIDRKDSDTLTIAYTGLAAAEAGKADRAERAAQRLLASATTNGGAMFWHEAEWTWRWWSDPIEETSVSALLLHATHHDQQAQAALAFVRAQRNGDWWYTTLDTAMASTAIAQIEGPDGADAPDETARVLVDDRTVATVKITSLLPDAADTHVVVPADVMRGAHTVTVQREGRGNLYWSSDFEKYADANAANARSASEGVLARLFAKPPALTVSRRYSVGHDGAWRVGDEVTCDLYITARDGAQYVTLEDPYPAGTEYQPLQGGGAGWSWSGDQFLDDHAAFFFRAMWAGDTIHLSYKLRATTPGTFAAPGPSAFASYGPPVAAVGTGERVTIQP